MVKRDLNMIGDKDSRFGSLTGSVGVFLLMFFAIIIILQISACSTFWNILRVEAGFAQSLAVVITGICEVLEWGISKMFLGAMQRRKVREEEREKIREETRKESLKEIERLKEVNTKLMNQLNSKGILFNNKNFMD